MRFACAGKTLTFSGDTIWVDNLLPAADGADLFIAECFSFDELPGYHMNWRVIERNLDALGAKRVMLTHMNTDMLARAAQIDDPRVIVAADGLTIDI